MFITISDEDAKYIAIQKKKPWFHPFRQEFQQQNKQQTVKLLCSNTFIFPVDYTESNNNERSCSTVLSS